MGLLAGFIGSLIGVGGGSIMVPILITVGVEPHVAVASALVAILGTSLGGLRRLASKGLVKFKLAALLLSASMMGALVGASIGARLPGRVVAALVGAFLLAASLVVGRLASKPRRRVKADKRRLLVAWLIALVAGVVASIVGKGGGTFNVPLLVGLLGLDTRTAAATSKLMVGVNAAVAAAVYAAHGYLDPQLALSLLIGTYTGATLGSRLLITLPSRLHARLVSGIYAALGLLALAKAATMH